MATLSFKPIIDEQRFQAALEYVASHSRQLAKRLTGKDLTFDTLCLFTHDDDEYAFVRETIMALGDKSRFSHGPTLYVDVDMAVKGQAIKLLGVRKPDSERPQVGYADFPVADYDAMLVSLQANPGIQEITSGQDIPLIELRHPDFKVLGYIIGKSDHE